jgi:hypothetical protein
MSDNMRARLCLTALIAGLLLAAACSSGPPAPQMGTPPFYWQAAGETFRAGDYMKAADHLEQLCKKESEFTERARPWHLVLTGGMAKGYMELGDAFEEGARANRANPTPFRRHANDLRTMAARRSLQFAETFRDFAKHDHTKPVPLAFAFPAGSIAPIQDLGRISSGVPLPQTQIETIQARSVERGVLRAVTAAVGALDDVAKAQSTFQAGTASVDHDTFALAMATMLHDQATLFARDKLDMPDRMKLFCDQATEALKNMKETKESKELAAKIQKTLKGPKGQ